MEPILQNYLNEVKILAQRQYQADKAEYENSLNAKKE
jgi:hypothetical protein